jgi:hypothetical protein
MRYKISSSFVVFSLLLLLLLFYFSFFLALPRVSANSEEKTSNFTEKVVGILDYLSSITNLDIGIDLDDARYFSDNLWIHPLSSMSLRDMKRSIFWFSKTADLFSKEESISSYFFAIAKYSSKIKRIDLVSNPASKYFSGKGHEVNLQGVKIVQGKIEDEAVLNFARCLSQPYYRFKNYVEAQGLKPQKIYDFKDLNKLSALAFGMGESKIYDFLEVLNTAEYSVLLCLQEFLKSDIKKIGNFTADFGDFMLISATEPTVIIPPSPSIIIDPYGKDNLYILGGENDQPTLMVIVDVGGNDRYIFSHPRSLYLSVIYDFSGNDYYKCSFACAGGGLLGAEALFDLEGDDIYESKGISQGAGILGTGLLLDKKGSDTYISVTLSQGFGSLGGGLLLDKAGNDKYIIKDGNENPSYQDSRRNLSMGQGCGSGLRADYIDGARSLPGGVGLLYDFEGNDEYSAVVFSQGCGYWYGIGVIFDASGDDKYTGYWYCQGSSAHFGVGLFFDLSGSDKYICDFQGMGHGHDLGIGIFLDYDESDNDRFDCKVRCLGMAHANGLSLFANFGGNDEYKAEELAFGDVLIDMYRRKKKTIRDVIKSYGFFFDIGGGEDKFFLKNELIIPEKIREMLLIDGKNPFLRKFFFKLH